VPIITKLIDNKLSTLDAVINQLESIRSETLIQEELKATKLFNANQNVSLEDMSIQFNCFSLSYPSETEEDVMSNNFLVVYSVNNEKPGFIIDKNSRAATLLRRFLGCANKRGEVEIISSSIDTDMLIWLISRVYLHQNQYTVTDGEILTVNNIIGFRGGTTDDITRISAAGNTVLNILSTLSFILESNNLKQTMLRLSYKQNSNIELKLYSNGTVGIETGSYIGEFDDDTNNDLKKAKLYLLVYLVIIPLLCEWYGDNIWNSKKYQEFLREIGESLSKKINEKINEIPSEDE
jgi:hypothetical protein